MQTRGEYRELTVARNVDLFGQFGNIDVEPVLDFV